MALYYVEANGPQGFRASAFRKALATAVRLAKEGGSNHVIILVHKFENLRGSALEEVIGETAVAKLIKTKQGLSDGVTITLDSAKLACASRRAVLLAAYVSNDLRNKAIAEFNASDVVFLPWAEAELDDFELTYPAARAL